MAIITSDEFKEMIGVSGADNDTIIASVIAYTEGIVKQILGRDIESTSSENEVLDSFENEILLKHFPVISIETFEYSDDDTALVANTDYSLDSEIGVVHNLGTHIHMRRNIRITYTHGFATIPEGIKLPVLQLARFFYGHFQPPDGGTPIFSNWNVSSVPSNVGDISLENNETYNRIISQLKMYRKVNVPRR